MGPLMFGMLREYQVLYQFEQNDELGRDIDVGNDAAGPS